MWCIKNHVNYGKNDGIWLQLYRFIPLNKDGIWMGKIRRKITGNDGRLVGESWENGDEPVDLWIPSGKHTHNYGKIHRFLMGKSTISMAIFNSELLVYQRVSYFQSKPYERQNRNLGVSRFAELWDFGWCHCERSLVPYPPPVTVQWFLVKNHLETSLRRSPGELKEMLLQET